MSTLHREPIRHAAPSVRTHRLRDGVQDQALTLVLFALTAGTVLSAAMLHAPALIVLVLAAAPILVIVGAKHALLVLPALILVRALVDNLDLQIATAGVAVGLVGLALLVIWRSATWLLVLIAVSGYLLLSAWAGAPTYGGSTTFGEALRLISVLAVMLVVLNGPGRLTATGVARSVQLVGLIPAVLALVQFVTGTGDYIDGVVRATGTLAQANSAAALFATCNVASFALLMARAPRRGLNIGLFALFLGAQLATGSIGGAAACLVMVVVHLLTLRATRAERVLLAIVGIGLVVYLGATSGIGSSRLGEYIGTDASPLTTDNSLSWRIKAWGRVLNDWRLHPVLGNGVGAARADVFLGGNYPHNEYVRLLAETGVVGLTMVLTVCATYARRLLRALHTSDDFGPSLGLAVLAGSLVNGIAANTMLYTVSFYVTMFVLAGCWRAVLDERKIASTPGHAGAAPLGAAPSGGRTSTVDLPA